MANRFSEGFNGFKMKKIIYISIIILFVNGCTKELVISNPGYTIGVIYEYVPGWAEGPTSVRFEYVVNNKTYHTGYTNGDHGWKIPGNAGYKQGDMFMVQYDIENIKIARMLFDYPVKDTTDYERYIEQFRINPPKK